MRASVLAVVLSVGCAHQSAPANSQSVEDFEQLWHFVDEHYPYFAEKAVDWQRARELHLPEAESALDGEALLHVLEALLDELYDPHCMLNANSAASWRPVPYDLFVEPRGARVLVTGVRQGSAAAAAGVRPGQELLAIHRRPPLDAVATRLPKALKQPDAAAVQWALLSLVAGRHGSTRRFTVLDHGVRRELTLRLGPLSAAPEQLSFRRLSDGLGYVRVPSFADEAAVAQFDAALEALRDAPGLLLDVRSNGGGDTAVALPMVGRFITQSARYAWMAKRQGPGLGARWPEEVSPRGPWTYQGRVVVLVDRFSVSMAEGFAMAMQGLGRARLVGTKMAGLGAAIARVTLGRSGISAQISAEPVFRADGAPRNAVVPDVEVDVLSASGEDPILAAGQAELQRLLAAHR